MSLPAKRKGAGEEAADDVVGQPGSTVKRQRTDEAGTATVKREPSDRSAYSDSGEISLERAVEQEERPISPMTRIVKLRDGQGIIKQEEPPTSHINVTATKMESPARLQSRERGSSGIPDTTEEPSERQQRRSAAPSPFASAHSAQRRLIGLQDIPSVLASVLVPGASNPGRCPCGHYLFYAVCRHVCRTEAFKCGARRARSGAAVFCAVPAPRHNVDDCIVNQPCPHCLDPTPVVLLGQ
ncbi:hypothetical protein LMH87_003758 [Akanthomyces muscarius]|uniref:Uncharacterized protein n=1 Tax=Akanthomyces muscarius TaxID=2231603 RepID=A0A9W8Q2E8_AKAMU|nr:hypothetical protein LMH87_003758 [Akanthomyces muscarius]KAJ4144890.1 hypothetical protein LMH87_003758 [Akanthomyces muscarius]